MFVGEMSLKRWVNKSLPCAIFEVIDADILKRDDEHFQSPGALRKIHHGIGYFLLCIFARRKSQHDGRRSYAQDQF